MQWTCRIDPRALTDNDTIARTPMALVQLAQDLGVWPQEIRIASTDLPRDEERPQWEAACRTGAEHNVAIWLDDMQWNPQDALLPRWPAGNPMNWDRETPGAWDSASGSLTAEAGKIWWQRQRGSGTWVIASLIDSQQVSTPEAIGVALQATCPVRAARVSLGDRKWWCAWPRTDETMSGPDWARRLWATLGTVRIGTSLVTEPDRWADRLKQAVNVARNEPGVRVAALPPDATEILRQETLAQIAVVQAQEEQRQREEEQRHAAQERQKAAQDELDRLAAERSQLLAQKQQLAMEAESRCRAQAERLRQEIDQLRTEQESVAQDVVESDMDRGPVGVNDKPIAVDEDLPSEAVDKIRSAEGIEPGSSSECPALGSEVSKPDTNSSNSSTDELGGHQPLRRHRLPLVPSHWRPEQSPQWNRQEVVTPPPRKRRPLAESTKESDASLAIPEPILLPTSRKHQTGDAAPPTISLESRHETGLAAPWVAWFWGDARKSGTSTAALAFARWLAWVQTTPVRLLEGNLMTPGLARLIQTHSIPLTWGWEGPWTAGKPMCDPRSPIVLSERLTVWALAPQSITKVFKVETKWRQVLQHMGDVLIVVDGGLMPPPVPNIDLPICVIQRGTHTPDVPSQAWVAYRGVPMKSERVLRLPSEALGVEGVGSAAWTTVWDPVLSTLGLWSQEGMK